MKQFLASILLLIVAVAVGLGIRHRALMNSREAFMPYDLATSWKDICRDKFRESVPPEGRADSGPLSPDDANAPYLPLPLPAMPNGEALENWGSVTSQRCFSLDQSEALRPVNKTTNLLQRTNNYPRDHPDSCSAPSHEFLSTFYSPGGAIQSTPPRGTQFPPSTQCS
jgi:hypothetical protein